MSLVSISYLVRVGKTHWKGHQDPSKSDPIFLRGTEANLKMVPIDHQLTRFPFRGYVLYGSNLNTFHGYLGSCKNTAISNKLRKTVLLSVQDNGKWLRSFGDSRAALYKLPDV